jgi:hypothetical protein
VNNASGADANLEVEAVCGTKPTGYRIVQAPIIRNAAGHQTTAAATCPSGTEPLGGGATTTSADAFVNTNRVAVCASR